MFRKAARLSSWLSFNYRPVRPTGTFYLTQMYDTWLKDPNSVHESWRNYFSRADSQVLEKLNSQSSLGDLREEAKEVIKIALLHRAFQIHGFMLADLDPLKLHSLVSDHGVDVRLPGPIRLENYHFSPEDMEKTYDISNHMISGFTSLNGPSHGKWKLKEFIEKLKKAYCSNIGFEFFHIPFRDETNWMIERIEKDHQFIYNADQKKNLLKKLARAELLEKFLHKKFTTHKRFGLDGLESLILSVEAVIERAVDQGIDTFVIGMPHRGRLNMLANICGSSLTDMFGMFLGSNARLLEEGDVKYHLGHTAIRTINGKSATISLLANPSHLEAVDTVAVGKAHAMQFYQNSPDRTMCILIHGDAALAGQGVVFEQIQMEDLYDYSTGGVIHIVANNNIGFTTTPREARSGLFPTEIAKSISAPIIHVNGDCPEEVDYVSRVACDWRKEFGKSIFIDIIGYRRYGHNELDEPLFTNPKMYQIISKRESCYDLYTKRLINEKILSGEEASSLTQSVLNDYESSFSTAKEFSEDELKNRNKNYTEWSPIKTAQRDPRRTGISVERAKELGLQINTIPEDFHAHPSITKIFKQRYNSIENGRGIDWATAETLAWASLLADDSVHVRISGEDVQRGTFSQRHAVIHDQKNEKTYTPLNFLAKNQAKFTAVNSLLSEMGVLGFEYGFSLANPNALVLWEAQFGDFANGAQIIIDQFITSGEAKWGQEAGLVILLPHGYDGQGSEHSCGRIERILQLSADDPNNIPTDWINEGMQIYHNNIQVVMPSNPANYFHMLRRQIRREFRKPLFVFSPKRLLRHKEAVSTIEEFNNDRVSRAYDDSSKDLVENEKIRKVIFCSGQVYYDLVEERRKRDIKDVAICRIEQIAPFPFDRVQHQAHKYINATYHWVQEEPLNLGPWGYVQPRIDTALKALGFGPVGVVSRPPSAAAASGYASVHTKQLIELLDKAMN